MDKEEIRSKAIEQTSKELKSPVDRDKFLVKTVGHLDRLRTDFFHDVEDLRDIYSLHFPEFVEEINDDKRFIELLDRYGVERSDLEPFQSLAEASSGSSLPEKERKIMADMVSNLVETKNSIESLEEYIENEASEEFQNLSGLLGPVLATRLVSLAGSLDELAKKPASTVQMLGAEKALFRYLHGEGTPPKHGILFNHRFVKDLPEDKRGKMARFMANKAVMAARIDNYGDEDKSENLREECSDKYSELSS